MSQELFTSTPPPEGPHNRIITPHTLKLYMLSALISAVCVAALFYIWYGVYTAPDELFPGEVLVTTEPEVQNYMRARLPAAGVANGDPVTLVPTGIVMQSVEFKGPYTLQISGYVWQRYPDSAPANINYGVVLPEAESTTFTQVYETHQGDETLVGWNFKATMREVFDYSRYPLDRQQIWIRFWHPDFERNVYLVPDIEGYESLDPKRLPGLDPGLVLENWKFEQSFFSFRENRYNANFGIQGYQSDLPQPELYFNISIRRNLLTALVARFVAPMIILIQLFVVVMVIGTDTKRLDLFGVKPGAVIFTCAAFYFAVLVAQNSLRDEVKTYGVVYLEWLHILTYSVIVTVAANAVALVAFPELRFFRDSDNVWVEFLYWPLILTVTLIITVFTFR